MPEYSWLHPRGNANGQNVFCVGKNTDGQLLYLGFGSFFSTPKTETEIINALYEDTMEPSTHPQAAELQSALTRDAWNAKRNSQQLNFPACIFDVSMLMLIFRYAATSSETPSPYQVS